MESLNFYASSIFKSLHCFSTQHNSTVDTLCAIGFASNSNEM